MEKFGINLDDEVYTCLTCEHKHATVEKAMDHIRRVHANRDTQMRSDSRGSEVYETDSGSVFTTSSDISDSDYEVKKDKPMMSRQPKKRKLKSVSARELPSQSKRKPSNLTNQDDSSQPEKGATPLNTEDDGLIQTGPNTFLYLDKFSLEKVEKGYKCDHCGLIEDQPTKIKFHIRHAHARKAACGQICRILQKYKKQRLIRTGYGTFVYMEKFGIGFDDEVYTCRVCGHKHVKVEKVMDHIRTVHAENGPHRAKVLMVEKSPKKWYYDEYAAEKVENEYRCVTCNYFSEDQVKMRHHLRYSHYLVAHPEEAPSSSFVCEVCGREFHTQFWLKEHQNTHSEELKFTCECCGQRINARHKLRLQMRVHLGDEGKRFVCELCGRKFWDESTLKTHLFHHTGQRQFECKTCGKLYASDATLSQHRTSHTGKNYSCDICGMEFTQAYSVVRHKGTAHGRKKSKKRKTGVDKKSIR